MRLAGGRATALAAAIAAVLLFGAGGAQACRTPFPTWSQVSFVAPPDNTPDEALVLKLRVVSAAKPEPSAGLVADVVGVEQGWRPAARITVAESLIAFCGWQFLPKSGETVWMVGRMHARPDGERVFMPYRLVQQALGPPTSRRHAKRQPSYWEDTCPHECLRPRLSAKPA